MKSKDYNVHEYIFNIQQQCCIPKLAVAKSYLGDFNGLFAREFIPKGRIICKYSGILLSTKQAIRLSDKSYLMRLGEQKYIDARDCIHVFARYINDCINGTGHNVIFDKRPDENLAFVIAKRDIFPDEEIFVDYGKWYWFGSQIKPRKLSSVNIYQMHETLKIAFEEKSNESSNDNVKITN